jgi:hypothetical protein
MTDTPQASTLSRRAALAVLGAAAAAAVASPAFAVGAIKHYIIIDLKPGMDMLALDRWYMTFHAPQVRRAFKAWQRNYVSYRSYAVTEEARKLGVLNGRMTEIQFDSLADFRESRPNNLYGDLRSFTPPPKGWSGAQFETTTATIPVNPQTVFLSNPTPPKETPYLRWIVLFRYPAGVTAETGRCLVQGRTCAPDRKAAGRAPLRRLQHRDGQRRLSPRRGDLVRRLRRLEVRLRRSRADLHRAAVGRPVSVCRDAVNVHRRESRRRFHQRQAGHPLATEGVEQGLEERVVGPCVGLAA